MTTGNQNDFFGISFDGGANEIPHSGRVGKYDISSDPVTGGMIVTLLPAYLATLPDGPHTLTFLYNGSVNTVSTVFYIGNSTPGSGNRYGEAGSNAPKTGDGAPLALLCGLALLSGAGLMASVAHGRRKRHEN